jgi:cell division protein FtsW
MLAKKAGVIKDMKEVTIHIMAPIVLICGLIMLDNLSSAAILFMTCIVVLFIGRVSTKFIMAIFGGGFVMASLIVAFSWFFLPDHGRADVWLSRLTSWQNPDITSDDFYQQKQAYIAIAKGGLFRIAPGKSTQCNFLPDAFSDFIYSTLIEEYGLLGGAFVLFLYLFFYVATDTSGKKQSASIWCTHGCWVGCQYGAASSDTYGCQCAFVAKYRNHLAIYKLGWNQYLV